MIRMSDVYLTYPNGTRSLKGVTLKINDGEFVFLVGPSGAGKSTISKLLTCEIRPGEGTVEVNGFNTGIIKNSMIPHLRRTIGAVFQDFRLIENQTVYENVAFAMRVTGKPASEIKKRVPYVLNLVGLSHKARRKPGELSGGEQQRVAIARAFSNNPKLIIADEPTGNLDPERSLEIMTLLERINAHGVTVLVISHEKELVNRFEKRVIALENGRVVSDIQRGGYYQYDEIQL
jgi:cell division transport system ATP-binding protein